MKSQMSHDHGEERDIIILLFFRRGLGPYILVNRPPNR